MFLMSPLGRMFGLSYASPHRWPTVEPIPTGPQTSLAIVAAFRDYLHDRVVVRTRSLVITGSGRSVLLVIRLGTTSRGVAEEVRRTIRREYSGACVRPSVYDSECWLVDVPNVLPARG